MAPARAWCVRYTARATTAQPARPPMTIAQFRFYEELNDFLAPARRKRSFELRCAEAATVKNAIESAGVPHTEVELILANGESVAFSYRVQHGDRISVYPMFESFDVTPYAKACSKFLLGHPDTQGFGRKFKVAFSGCKDHACGLVNMHDMGFIAKNVTYVLALTVPRGARSAGRARIETAPRRCGCGRRFRV